LASRSWPFGRFYAVREAQKTILEPLQPRLTH